MVDVGAIHREQHLFYPIKKTQHMSIETVDRITDRGKRGALWIVGMIIIILSLSVVRKDVTDDVAEITVNLEE
jgi:hypothetical protein